MVGEHARCLYKMSQILHKIPGRRFEADMYLRRAKQLYKKRMEGPELSNEAERLIQQIEPLDGRKLEEADYDALVYVHWR